MADLNFDTIASIVRDAGHDCIVESTGGGTATIMAGVPKDDEHGDRRFPILAGPGYFEGGLWTGTPLGHTDEFYVGPDTGDAADEIYVATDEDTHETLARKIIEGLQAACSCNPERPGDCRSLGCDPECEVC